MKNFCYANVVMINWLKNTIFSAVYLGSLTYGVKNLENVI